MLKASNWRTIQKLKADKTLGFNDINVDFIKKIYDEIKNVYIFNLSFNIGNFPDKMKIGRVSPPMFKNGEEYLLVIY